MLRNCLYVSFVYCLSRWILVQWRNSLWFVWWLIYLNVLKLQSRKKTYVKINESCCHGTYSRSALCWNGEFVWKLAACISTVIFPHLHKYLCSRVLSCVWLPPSHWFLLLRAVYCSFLGYSLWLHLSLSIDSKFCPILLKQGVEFVSMASCL